MNKTKFISKLLFLLFGVTMYGQIDPGDIGVVVTNEAIINSEKLEYSPAFYEDGVVFISTNFENVRYKVKDSRIDKNIMSIYWAQRDSLGGLLAPVPFAGELLTRVHEGPLTFDRTGEQMFFTRNNNVKGKRKISSDGISKLKIYSAIKFKDDWTAVEDLSFNMDESNTCHPAISVEGDKLYFASDREGGQGGMDIWVVRRKGDSWGEPVNLGPKVNSPGNDAFPFIHADGTLYFASDGHAGLGGYDLFYALAEGTSFAAPINLKAPFNTEADDFAMIVDRDKRNGYFSSNRKAGLGDDDIYNFYLTGNKSIVGDPNSKADMQKSKVWFILKDKFSGEVIPEANVSALNLGLATDNVVTDNAGLIGNYIPMGDFYNKILVELELDSTDVFGQTDFEGRIPIVLIGNENVINFQKPGYQNKQVVLSSFTEGEEIYVELEKINNPIPFTGEVLGVLGKPMAGATILMEDEDGHSDQLTAGPDGKFQYMLSRNKIYKVSIIQDGKKVSTHQIGSIDSEANAGRPMGMTFDLAENETLGLKEGLVIELPNIYYNFNDASIRPDARKDLDLVVDVLRKYPNMAIELGSHTDSRGGTRYNKKLSQKRAENAVAYLVNQGLDAARIAPIGYGETVIRNKCTDGKKCAESDHQYNRRTEIKVTKFDRPATEVKFVQVTSRIGEDVNPQSVSTPSSTSSNSNTISIAPKPNAVGGRSVLKGGEYFRVIAGTFEVEENASERLTEVRNMGFEAAEIIPLKNGSLKAVSVGSFENNAEARNLVKALKEQHQLRSYIKRMKD